VATTGGGGAGAVRVSGVPPGGVSGAGAAADDVGSVIDFLSGAGIWALRFYRKQVPIWALTSLLDGRCGNWSTEKRSRSLPGSPSVAVCVLRL
jgi:hypothetical protein